MIRTIVVVTLLTLNLVSVAHGCPTSVVAVAVRLNKTAPLTSIPETTSFSELDSSASFRQDLTVYDFNDMAHPVALYFFRVSSSENVDEWSVVAYTDGREIFGGNSGEASRISNVETIALNSLNPSSQEMFFDFFSATWNTASDSPQSWNLVLGQNFLSDSSGLVSLVQDGRVGLCLESDVNHLDIDGDDRADLTIWRPELGMWAILKSGNGYTEALWKQWGLPGDYPMSGDYTGDKKMDLVVWRPENGNWYVCTSDSDFDCSQGTVTQFGLPGDRPLAGDFDGDQIYDFAVWRPSLGFFIFRSSVANSTEVRQWGLPSDIPMSAGNNN
ncbi:MAG: hypothetical protein KDD60_00015 [Bdellovibrionales bacterium]|nr:hypothetical protein [Bdellovibrionales bacterium]